MRIGIPKEIKPQEFRVSATPGAVQALVSAGHSVLVERGAGVGSSFADEEYVAAGATLGAAADAWAQELILKVKEPMASEYQYLRDDQIIFTYLHLAADRALTEALLAAGTTAVAYETVQQPNGALPLLTPMSEVAGRMAPQGGAHFLERAHGGRGLLLSGVPGVQGGTVTVLGAGMVGTNAAKLALGLGARVNLLDVHHARLQYLDDVFNGRIQTTTSNLGNILELLPQTDLLIGAVLIPGARAPRLVTRDMLALMKPGSVIVDVAVDQGGCIETIHPTTHESPIYEVDGVVHYGVSNMPGAVPNTSTKALANQTLPYVLKLAGAGLEALRTDQTFLKGLNTHSGKLTYAAVGQAFDISVVDAERALSGAAPALS